MAKPWTPDRRARQAAMIHRWKPWKHSTGPKTAAGKAIVARNPHRGAYREVLRSVSKVLRRQEKALARAAEE